MDFSRYASKINCAGDGDMGMGSALQCHRVELGISQRQLSSYLGVSLSTIRRWEHGSICGHASVKKKMDRFLNGDFDRELCTVNICPPELETRLKNYLGRGQSFLRCTLALGRCGRDGEDALKNLAQDFNTIVNRCLEELIRRSRHNGEICCVMYGAATPG